MKGWKLEDMWSPGDDYKVILFYRYVFIEEVESFIEELKRKCESWGLLGRILVAKEGINGTLAGSLENVDNFIQCLSNDIRFQLIDWKSTIVSKSQYLPFLSLSIREVSEIISCGNKKELVNSAIEFDPSTFGGLQGTGKHLTPIEFHQMLSQMELNQGKEDFLLLDIRNEFEYNIGHFEQARNIGTVVYSETFQKLDQILRNPPLEQSLPAPVENEKQPKILMYCTGGIRCEKASAFLKAKGYEEVYQVNNFL